MRRDNFFSYRNILTIDPGWSFQNGAGIALFDEETHRLKACGLLRLFAPGMEDHQATMEIAEKSRKFWEEHVGFSYDPEILCIEYPQQCFIRNGHMVRPNSIIMLGILCARIEAKFSPKISFRPSPQTWKGQKSKEQTQQFVMEKLCAPSKAVLTKNLSCIPNRFHHNVYDAVALGLWAIANRAQARQIKPELALVSRETQPITAHINSNQYSSVKCRRN